MDGEIAARVIDIAQAHAARAQASVDLPPEPLSADDLRAVISAVDEPARRRAAQAFVRGLVGCGLPLPTTSA
ncbi:hypothetical protein AB0E12_11125 [Micromonospora chersina]|uniref:hypothetical protein n=1 Tax=Micromonospora chersina TaxID=47854 RepID=UPI0033D84325